MSTASYTSHAMNHKLTGSMVTLNRKPDPPLEYGASKLPLRTGTRRRSLSASRSSSTTGVSCVTGHHKLLADERLSLNVGGTRYQTLRSTLARLPHTTLGELARNSQSFADEHLRPDYFFDRSSALFDNILNFYRTGELHFPHSFCPSIVSRELDFWKISCNDLQDCCWSRYLKHVQRQKDSRAIERIVPEIFHKAREQRSSINSSSSSSSSSAAGRRSRRSHFYTNDQEDQTPEGFLQSFTTSRPYVYFRLLCAAIASTVQDLRLYLLLLSAAVFLCSLLLLITERREGIHLLPGALWVALLAVTGSGFGATFPFTFAGTILVSVCVVLGVLMCGVPVPVVASRFVYYRELLEERLLLSEEDSDRYISNTYENGKIK